MLLCFVNSYKYITTLTGTSNESTVPIIAGSIGGAVVFSIILLFCVLILCIRLSRKGSGVNVTNLPSNITEQNKKQQNQCDDDLQNKFFHLNNLQDTIKMDSNPSYGQVQCSDTVTDDATEQPHYNNYATIQTNSSYNFISDSVPKDKDQNGYIETNSFNALEMDYLEVIAKVNTKEEQSLCKPATNGTNNVEIDPNPSYDLISGGVILEDNPSYNEVKRT